VDVNIQHSLEDLKAVILSSGSQEALQ